VTTTQLHEGSWNLHNMLALSPGLLALTDALTALAEEGVPVVVATADLKYSNGLVRFQERHPDRFIQFGISEQNMVSACAGLATVGLRPYAATFASFLALLCCEQIRTDIAYTGLPVTLIGHHSGITLGFYGTSHHATEDLAAMRSMAGLVVAAPADRFALAAALRATAELEGPIYIRIGRGREPDVYQHDLNLKLGTAIAHGEGRDLTLIATGSMVHPTLDAARRLRSDALSVGVLDMHTIKPLDEESVLRAANTSALLMTVEEHNIIGGLGGAVAEVVAANAPGTPVHRHGIRDEYSLIGPPTHLYRHYRLDADGIEAQARAALAALK
jgi:transketolase